MGIKSYATLNGKIVVNETWFNQWYQKNSWFHEEIRILNNYAFDERSERIVKALEYMAVKNGAILKSSYF